MGFPLGPAVKNLLAMQIMQETLVLSLGWEDPLEEGMVTLSSILAWRIPMDRGVIVHRVAESDMTEVTEHTHTESLWTEHVDATGRQRVGGFR